MSDSHSPPPPIEVDRADSDAWREIGSMLADAFQDDPVWMWVAPDEKRRRRHLAPMFSQVIRARVEAGLAYTTADIDGAAVWAAPDRWKMTGVENMRSLVPSLRAIGLRPLRRAVGALTAIDKLHPTEPHWYLEFLASRADRRGQGYGSALLQPVLEQCDEQGLPAYLESSKPENLPFYSRFGFEVTAEFRIGDDSPPMWSMWREPH